MLNAAVVREKLRQNACLCAHKNMSPSLESLDRLAEYVVRLKYITEFRDQLVVHAVLLYTPSHEEVDQIVAGLIPAFAIGYGRKQKSHGNYNGGAWAAVTLPLPLSGCGASSL